MKLAVALTILAALPSLAQAQLSPACEAVTRRSFDRLADLPRGAEQAMAIEMAEKGKPFQSTDVVTRPDLPRRRFVSAVQQRCRLTIAYEQGGIAHGWSRLILIGDRSGGWKIGI